MAAMISGVILVAALVVVAALSGWLVVGMFRVSRSQPAHSDAEDAG
jgi:hypothetical protein